MSEKLLFVWHDVAGSTPSTSVELALSRAGGIKHDSISELESAAVKARPMNKMADGSFQLQMELDFGMYHYLFLVEGTWRVSDMQSKTMLASGKTVNYCEVPTAKLTTFTDEMFEDMPLLPEKRAEETHGGGACCCTIL